MAGAKIVIALAFAAIIVVEPVADTHCHRIVALGPLTLAGDTASPSGDAADPCGSTCVPDCYCCNTSLVCSTGFVPPVAWLAGSADALAPLALDGVAAVPDLPPIA